MKKSMRYLLSVLAVLTLAVCKTTPEDSSVDGTAQAADLDTMRQKSYLELLLQGAAVPFVSLLDDGAVDIEWSDEDGAGYLHHAVWNNQSEIAAALVHAGADVNLPRKDGYRPLHWAAYRGSDELCGLLLEAGADVDALGSGTTALYWAVAHRHTDTVNLLLGWGADAALADSGFPSALSWAAEELDPRLPDYYLRYGSTALAAVLNSPEAFERGKPDLPPRAKAELSFTGTAAYRSRALISVEASNIGNGVLYELVATVAVDERKLPYQMYFGRLEPGETARRTLAFSDIRYTDTGTELPFTVTFTEANQYDPPPLRGKLAILKPDPAFIIDHIVDLNSTELQHFLDNDFILPADVCRAVLLRASDLGMAKVITLLDGNGIDRTVVDELAQIDKLPYRVNNIIIENFTTMSNAQLRFFLDKEYVAATDIYQSTLRRAAQLGMVKIKSLLDDNLIDRSVVDKLIHFDKLPYDIDDLIHFADKKAITQEYLELALLDGRVEFDASHLLELGRNDYLSRQVAEAFYANGMTFSRNQIQELGRLDIFSLPEVLYTYTIDDGDSATSTGNGDGMIQIREGVDFHFIIKNASRYDIEDVRVVLEQSASAIDLYSQPKNLSVFKMDDTISMDATIGVKSSFKGSTLPMRVLVSSPQFGTMLDEKIDVPVGQTVGSPVLALNKQVSARDSIIVRSGASEKSPRIASLARGAVFTAVGELNGWYKVGVYGRSGWIQKTETLDYNQPTESTFLVENLRESTQGLVDDSKDAGVYGELTFVNAKPVLIIVSPRGGEDVYNAAEMDIQAVDRSFGISKIDVRINGAPLADAAARGLRRLGGVASRELRKTIPLILKKGKNEVEVTAYNSRNVASETQVLHLNSLGIKNPPSMYVLSVGVSRYAREDQNLQYARSDAEKIAALFRKQGGADIYKDVKIKTLYDEEATRSNIKDGVNYFLSEARKDDVAVFYFAGHGTTDARNEYYLMGHDGDMERPSSLGYKNRDLEEDLQSSVYAEKVLVMLDSCRSGQATGRRGAADIDAVVKQLVLASGYNVISAARGNEAAWERSDWGGGAFTYAIVRSLEGGLADANRDGFVSVNELEDSVYRQVLELTSGEQHPTFGTGDRSNEPYSFYQVK